MIKFLKKNRFEMVLFFAYLALALIWTWPLVLHFNSSIYGIRGDHFVQLWENWWQKEALLSGGSIFYTPLIDAPAGQSYAGTAIQPVNLALNLFLTLLTNEVVALNLLLLLSFPLSGLAVYFLVRELLGARKAWPCDSLAAAFAGLIYAFSMYHFSHAWEHSSLIATYWMAFYIWALVRLDRQNNLKTAVVAGVLLAITLLDNYYYGYLVGVFTLFFFVFRFFQTFGAERKNYFDKRRLKTLLLFAFCFLLLALPFALPILRGVVTTASESEEIAGSLQRPLHDVNWLAARPWFYLLPSPHHPLWGDLSQKVLDWIATKPPYFLTQPYAGREHNLYLGWTALILYAVAVLRSTRRVDGGTRRVWLFLFLAIVMAIFSAPPYATISLHKIYFPAHFLYPIFPMFRAYARFGVLVLLCVAVLAGFGLDLILEKTRSRRTRFILSSLFFILVFSEVALPSFNVDLTPPLVYLWLKEQPGDFVVVELPPRSDHSDVLYQRVHQKRLFNPSRENPQNLLYSLVDKKRFSKAVLKDVAMFPNELKEIGVKYIIFHKGDPLAPLPDDYLDCAGFKLIKEFDDDLVFEVIGK